MTDIAKLTAQIAALAASIEQFQPAAPSNVPLKPHPATRKPFKECPAGVRKAAHNAGRQAQRRTSKKAKNYTAKYKKGYDAHCQAQGFKGKYETRDAA
jgi:hypothetical protein